MKSEKTLLGLHVATIVALFVWLDDPISSEGYGSMIRATVFFVLTTATFASMYSFVRERLGRRYASKNLVLAIVFTPFAGIGILLWPYLVRNEARKVVGVSGTAVSEKQ